MIGVGDPVRGGVQVTDDMIGTHLPGAAEGAGEVQGVQVGDGDGIIGGVQDDTAWASGRGDIELKNLVHGEEPQTYHMAFLVKGGLRRYTVEGFQYKQRRRWKCRYISCTDMSWTPWSFWRMETPPTHGAPNVRLWSPGVN